MRRADVAAGPGMPVGAFVTLGNLYTSLYVETLADRATWARRANASTPRRWRPTPRA
ncbi:MAG: hypothetical protein R2851_22330 [Caldilineaceae bacterium]